MGSKETKDKKAWHTGLLQKEWGHSAVRLGHVKQLQGDYKKILTALSEKLGLDPEQYHYDGTLEDALGLKAMDFSNRDLVETRIAQALPDISKDNQCIIFQRSKDIASLARKEKEGRHTNDAYGMQVWVANPDIIRELETLENPQDELIRKWSKKGITLEIDDRYSLPKPHGNRAVNLDFNCPGNKGWTEGLEIQFMPINIMQPYLITRNVYKAYTAIKDAIEQEKGKNQNNWDMEHRDLLYPLRDYIKAVYEEATYQDDLMDLVNTGHAKAEYESEKEAAHAARLLRPIAMEITNAFYGMKEDAKEVLRFKSDILDDMKTRYGASGYGYGRLNIDD